MTRQRYSPRSYSQRQSSQAYPLPARQPLGSTSGNSRYDPQPPSQIKPDNHEFLPLPALPPPQIKYDAQGSTRHHLQTSFRYDRGDLRRLANAPRYPVPFLPSQRQAIQQRREQRRDRYSRKELKDFINKNPVYLTYRANSGKKGENEKWTDELENHFWDAYLKLPRMGRAKVAHPLLGNKLCGRNELIEDYLKIACPRFFRDFDSTSKRDRKMISSHIQTLKGLFHKQNQNEEGSLELRYHWIEQLFPTEHVQPEIAQIQKILADSKIPLTPVQKSTLKAYNDAKKARADAEHKVYKEVVKSDPFILAIQQDRLPGTPIRLVQPFSFELYRCRCGERHNPKGTDAVECIQKHEYANHDNFVYERSGDPDGDLLKLQQRFPQIAKIPDDMHGDIIHIQSTLDVACSFPTDGAELYTEFKVTLPDLGGRLQWRCKSTFSKPDELCSQYADDMPSTNFVFPIEQIQKGPQGRQLSFKMPSLAPSWAKAFAGLKHVIEQTRADEVTTYGHPSDISANLIEQITVCHALESWDGNASSDEDDYDGWKQRAVMALTFERGPTAKNGVNQCTNKWRYVTLNLRNHDVLEPHPGPYHEVQSRMNDNFNDVYRDTSLKIDINFDCMSYCPTPPLTATSQPTFTASPYSQFSQPSQNEGGAENMSFMSQTTQHSTDSLHTVHGDIFKNAQYISQPAGVAYSSQHFDGSAGYIPTDESMAMSFEQSSQTWQPESHLPAFGNENQLPPFNFNALPPLDASAAGMWTAVESFGKQDQWGVLEPNPGYVPQGQYGYEQRG